MDSKKKDCTKKSSKKKRSLRLNMPVSVFAHFIFDNFTAVLSVAWACGTRSIRLLSLIQHVFALSPFQAFGFIFRTLGVTFLEHVYVTLLLQLIKLKYLPMWYELLYYSCAIVLTTVGGRVKVWSIIVWNQVCLSCQNMSSKQRERAPTRTRVANMNARVSRGWTGLRLLAYDNKTESFRESCTKSTPVGLTCKWFSRPCYCLIQAV